MVVLIHTTRYGPVHQRGKNLLGLGPDGVELSLEGCEIIAASAATFASIGVHSQTEGIARRPPQGSGFLGISAMGDFSMPLGARGDPQTDKQWWVDQVT
jgi:hypothetical protein